MLNATTAPANIVPPPANIAPPPAIGAGPQAIFAGPPPAVDKMFENLYHGANPTLKATDLMAGLLMASVVDVVTNDSTDIDLAWKSGCWIDLHQDHSQSGW
jgi:hypothetical protein